MEATTVIAWIGAVTGTGGLLWDVYKWKQSGPQLRITVLPGMALAVPGRPDTGERFLLVKVVNHGQSNTTLTTLSFIHTDVPLKKAKKKPCYQFVVPQPEPGRLPHVLEPGEEWGGMIRQTDDVVRMARNGYLNCRVYHTLSKKPVVERVIIPPGE